MKQYLLLFTTMTCMSLLLVGCSQSALALGSEGHSKPVIATKKKRDRRSCIGQASYGNGKWRIIP